MSDSGVFAYEFDFTGFSMIFSDVIISIVQHNKQKNNLINIKGYFEVFSGEILKPGIHKT